MNSAQQLKFAYETPIYIEYEYWRENDKNKYKIHISFVNDEMAKKHFDLLYDKTQLPIALLDNRIVITNVYEISDIFQAGYYLGLKFKDEISAKDFRCLIIFSYNYSQGILNFVLPRMKLVKDTIAFNDILLPDFSLENRIRTTKIYDQCMFSLYILKELNTIPLELCLLIEKYLINSFFREDSLKRILQINNKLKIPKDMQLQKQFHKVDCRITFSSLNAKDKDSDPDYDLHLICQNEMEVHKLSQNIMRADIQLHYRVEKKSSHYLFSQRFIESLRSRYLF